jgi:probable F420-dependent oxidoreductase
VRVDGKLAVWDIDGIAAEAVRHEQSGYHGLWSSESTHDPFLPLVAAAEHTERLELGTAITVAFARSPMQLAYTAHDLRSYSGGRFVLGLGSQVEPHIRWRYSMPWSRPAARMREYLSALRAIWAAWNQGEKLDFRGDFYTHTLMPPFFTPEPGEAPRVFVAAVGAAMTEVVGEVADGLLAHAFTTERYLREVTVPTLERGLARSGRTRADLEISHQLLVATGPDLPGAVDAVRRQIAFYGSTPAYRGVLARHGWEELGVELTALSKSDRADRWQVMGSLVDDDVLNAFAVVGEPDALAAEIRRRFDGLVDRFSFYTPYEIDQAVFTPVVQRITAPRASPSARSRTAGEAPRPAPPR